jgi:GNAT superfamily N-acetyltransferase
VDVDEQACKSYSPATFLAMLNLASPCDGRSYMSSWRSAGFDMDALPDAARHQLLRSIGLRAYGLRETQPDEQGIRQGPEIVPGEEYFSWTGRAVVDVDPAETKACLWDYIAAVDKGPQAALRFHERWGLYVDNTWRGDGSGYWSVAEFQEEARRIRSVLIALVATEAGEVVGEDVLLALSRLAYDFDFARREDADEVLHRLGFKPGGEYNLPDHVTYPLFEEIRLERWRALRRGDQGLQLQAQLITGILNAEVGPDSGSFIWDGRGRRVERLARGVRAICWSHLAALFSAPTLDVFLCGVCGKPFEFEAGEYQRRPRRGAMRFCSTACRLEAKRESNRQSWREHGARWRPANERSQSGSQS